MTDNHPFSKREQEVIVLLMKGKSNKQIALALGISDHTVEFHLKNVYDKLQVGSRSEAIIKLGKSAGGNLGKSTVDGSAESIHNQDEYGMQPSGVSAGAAKTGSGGVGGLIGRHKMLIAAGIILVIIVLAILLVLVLSSPAQWAQYERECEYPDEATVGQAISRPNASGSKVHGQFGTMGGEPWSAQPGDVTYRNISLPENDGLYLKLRYSKNSPASAPILIYIDDEQEARGSILPVDQYSWDKFSWTDPIFLGKITAGVHSLRLFTQGQQYGVADLDKLVLTMDSP